MPGESAGDFNQAMMELGATVCTPRAPSCLTCPVRRFCAAQQKGVQESLPPPKKKAKPRVVSQVTVLVERQAKLLLVRRPPAGLWGGLWEPPTGELQTGEAPADAAARVVKAATGLRLGSLELVKKFEHALSHRTMRFFAFRAPALGRVRLAHYEAARWLAAASAANEVGVAAWAARLLEGATG